MPSPRQKALQGPELFFAVVSATGTSNASVCETLEECLTSVGYRCADPIRIIDLLRDTLKWSGIPRAPEEERIKRSMDAGNEFRRVTAMNDALALLAVGAIRDLRMRQTKQRFVPPERQAYILRSLKHPDEVKSLRRIWGSKFYVIGAYSPRHARVAHLSASIARSHHVTTADTYRGAAEELVQRDLEEQGLEYGQHLRDAFPLSDVFVNADDPSGLRKQLGTFFDLLLGSPFTTPNKDEHGMFLAQAAALRSAQCGRQVGAAITTEAGEVVAVGTNEVPKAGGGSYWSDDEYDGRDHVLGFDSSDRLKRGMLAELLERLRDAGWLASRLGSLETEELVKDALAGQSPVLRGSQLTNVLEYGRSVHAELTAITDAARRGVPVAGCTLYTTTFPCHHCARHIVAAGIRRVVYIEPYPKSLAGVLHLDAIATEEAPPRRGQISFEPFVGVAPNRYMELFAAPPRKVSGGRTVRWRRLGAKPRFASDLRMYLIRETQYFDALRSAMLKKGLRPRRAK